MMRQLSNDLLSKNRIHRSALLLLLLTCLGQIPGVMSQASVPVATQEMVRDQVHKELTMMKSSEAFQSIEAAHPNHEGQMTLELSIYKKGRVRSIYQVDSNIENVPFRNAIKNYIKEHRFDLKKMDKKTTQKVRYTFQFN